MYLAGISNLNDSSKNVAFILIIIRLILSFVSEFDDKLYILERQQTQLNKPSNNLFDTSKYIKNHLEADLKERQLPVGSLERQKAREETTYQNILIKKSLISYIDVVLICLICYNIIYSVVIYCIIF